MSEMASAISNPQPASTGWLKGRARGAMICGIFGSVWMFEAVFFGGIATPAWLVVTALLAVGLIVWPVAQLRSFRHLAYSLADRRLWTSVAKPYWTTVAVEWLACAGAVNWLLHIRRYDLLPQVLGVIIGLHFLPLARLFKAPIYYTTGTVMALGVLTTLLIPAGDIRNIAAYGVNGLTLWVTAVVILCRNATSRDEGKDTLRADGLD